MRKSVKSPFVLLTAVALTLALTACGGDDTTGESADQTTAAVATEDAAVDTATQSTESSAGDESGEASTSDVCALLDNDTISSITGIDFSSAVAKDDGAGTCDWDLTSSGGMAIVSVMTEDGADSSYEVNRGVAAGMFDDVTDVSIPGTDHAFSYMGGMVVAMDFDGHYVQLLFMSLGAETTDVSMTVKLAEEVAKNW